MTQFLCACQCFYCLRPSKREVSEASFATQEVTCEKLHVFESSNPLHMVTVGSAISLRLATAC